MVSANDPGGAGILGPTDATMLESLDMKPGHCIGEIVTTARGQRFTWTGAAWLWTP